MKPSGWQIGIVLVVGIIGVSLAAIWIRLAVSVVTPDNKVGFSLFLAASRLIMATVILLPTWKNLKFSKINPVANYYAIAAGICLAMHFATWITSLSYTSIVASTVLVTTNPIWIGLFSWWWYGEKLSRQGIMGIVIALIGGILIAIADTDGGSSSYSNAILGDILALVGAIMSSLYIIFGSQAQRRGLNTSNYIAIAYSTAALFLFPLPLLSQTSYFGYAPSVYLYIFLMAVMSQVIGHTSLNWSVRWISPTLVSLSLLLEPVVASCIGAIALGEIPSLSLFLGGSIILIGIAIFLRQETI
ncbi:DMT family transporter [Pleurocapsa sp. PCC 7319]|uniref:DMT family transporter n=1 Tax=Pleurocapsa sp. PCC 7319 TaxID=118161 RepID=UPI00034A00EE|nr:DMT family transporter [Pleurocapsa sp. PCC 7319]